MPIDRSSGLPREMGVSEAMMERPAVRVPLLASPEMFPPEVREELEACHRDSLALWGSWPRYFQMLGHAPASVRAWILLDQQLRAEYLRSDPEYVKLQELVIVKTALITGCNN